MVDLAGTKMGEILNKDPTSTRTGTVSRAHKTLSEANTDWRGEMLDMR